MTKRRIGRSTLQVQPFCFGGNVFGWTADEAMSFRLLDAFVDAGFDFIDTADVYSAWVPGHKGGESETVLGNWFKRSGKRDKIVLATKVGFVEGLKPATIHQAVEKSLQRLQTDHIDLYWSHKDDPATPLAETLGAYDDLIKAGKVRFIGASNYSAPRLKEALDVSAKNNLPRYECLQPEYNLVERKIFEGELQDLCVREDVGVIPFFALAAGFLTGKYRSEADLGKSVRGPRTAGKYLKSNGPQVLAAMDKVAAAHKATCAQVALAWIMARKGLTAPIASATNPTQLAELLGSVKLALTQADVAELDAASA
ncbi:MAG: aldo/keto reductase [Hyphomicrobiales bacterium]|nr:aldo/keto reductase [Hyphomicrobiales bacterium]